MKLYTIYFSKLLGGASQAVVNSIVYIVVAVVGLAVLFLVFRRVYFSQSKKRSAQKMFDKIHKPMNREDLPV